MYEALLSRAASDGIYVYEDVMPPSIKGLYADNTACINKSLTTTAKACALAEEIGHHHTSLGNLLDKGSLISRKQEHRARRYGHRLIVPLDRFVAAGQALVQGRHDVAEWLGVTEEFLQESIDHYQNKYGITATTGDYLIHFDPLYVVLANCWYGRNLMRFPY